MSVDVQRGVEVQTYESIYKKCKKKRKDKKSSENAIEKILKMG